MFVGYNEHYSRYAYRMLNLTTNSIINSQDIIRSNKTYAERKKIKTTISTAEDDTIELLTGIDIRTLISNSTKHNEEKLKDTDNKVFRAMKILESWFNPQATKAVENYNHRREMTLEQVNLALFSTKIIKEPTTYEEAINSEQKEDQVKWKKYCQQGIKRNGKKKYLGND
jgi:hypothetical protein